MQHGRGLTVLGDDERLLPFGEVADDLGGVGLEIADGADLAGVLHGSGSRGRVTECSPDSGRPATRTTIPAPSPRTRAPAQGRRARPDTVTADCRSRPSGVVPAIHSSRVSPRLSAGARPCPGDGFAAGCLSTTTTNTGQPLSVGLFVFREPPRRAGLRAILPVPGETPTDPFSHEFAPALPSLLSKSWPTSPFWHRDILCCVSGLHLCRGDRFAITCASPVLRENRGPGASAQIRWAGRQWAENEAPGSAAVGRGPGRGASARPGHRPALPTPAREGRTAQMSRTPAPSPAPVRCSFAADAYWFGA